MLKNFYFEFKDLFKKKKLNQVNNISSFIKTTLQKGVDTLANSYKKD